MKSKAVLTALLLGACFTANADIANPVELDSGLISGVNALSTGSGVQVFKGIPFAAAPVADLRWKAPQAVDSWLGVRDASEFGDVCIQNPGQGRPNISLLPGGPGASEDCLFLNVWTGAASAAEKRPVMVFIYGGAFTEGGGSALLYDGEELAKKGAIVITMNYRLGPFGFFVHPALTEESANKASGNYGLMDMLASLEWVQNNVSAFGGDPDNVTVFGQSAGAMAIASLVASPLADGLFHKAISQSGGWMGLGMGAMSLREAAEVRGLDAALTLGAESLDALRALPADQVQGALRGAGMVVDGWVIPEDPSLTFAAGRQNSVDVLLGSNKDEGSFIPVGPNVQQWQEQVQSRWGEAADMAQEYYPANSDEESALSSQYSFRDGTTWHMRMYGEAQAKLGKKAWVFFFAQNPPTDPASRNLFATHASEVPYVFNNIGETPLYPDGSSAALAVLSKPDLELADLMSSYWVNFARTGNPNVAGLPQWPEYTDLSSPVMILDENARVEENVASEKWAMYQQLYQQQMNAY